MPPWGYIHMESGRIWRNGAFCGTDFDLGIGFNNRRGGILAGYGFDAGFVNDLPVEEDLKLVYGGAVGFWFTFDDDRGDYQYNFNFLAPFVKLRWNSLELSYRGLVGVGVREADGKFGWNNHQLALGIYNEGSKRKGVKRFTKNIYKSINND
jgi:hypothetical protein